MVLLYLQLTLLRQKGEGVFFDVGQRKVAQSQKGYKHVQSTHTHTHIYILMVVHIFYIKISDTKDITSITNFTINLQISMSSITKKVI